jgi:hypothetical protein
MSKVVRIAAAVGLRPHCMYARTMLQKVLYRIYIYVNYTMIHNRALRLRERETADREVLTRHFHELLNLLSKLLAFSPRQPGPSRQITAWSSRAVIFVCKLPQISASGSLLVYLSSPFHPDAQQMRASLASSPLGTNMPKMSKLPVVRGEISASTGRSCDRDTS